MEDYKALIVGCVDEYMRSGEFEDAVRKRVAKCMGDAIDSSFAWGALRDAMKAKVTEVMVPYIERYDMGAYTAKLDVLLSEIAEQTAVADNRKILKNFGALMQDPEGDSITLEEVFRQYKKYVAHAADGRGLEVEEGQYLPITVYCEVEDRTWRGFGYRWEEAIVNLTAEHADDDERERLSTTLELHRSAIDDEDSFRLFTHGRQPTIRSLVLMNDFEVFLARLDRAFTRITGIKDMRDEVSIEAQPEYELV